ncbi:MAG: DUF4373 domain-containing protein [Tannerellaceae bacterium]|jgi:hypothetical protein|nr:DUF4373 domain-containing protein [Tannerellaceae bacterium]
MARPKKSGIDYFSFDVDFFQDEKVQFVSARFGLKGEAITIRLLCKIYRNGYYCEFNDDAALLFAKGVGDGCQDSCVKDVVYELLKRGFFDKSIFERFGILTSKGIQNRYFEAAKRYKSIDVMSDYLLIDVPKTEGVNFINVAETPINVAETGALIKRQYNIKTKTKEISPSGDMKKDASASSPSPEYQKFMEWIEDHAPYCANPKNFTHQISESELLKLKENYTGQEIASIIEQIENRKDLRKKYTNLYRTVLNWAKKDYGR